MASNVDSSYWDAHYAEHGVRWGRLPAISAEETWWRLRGTGARRVLVAGCGYGRHAAYFARLGLDTTGLDSSRAAIDMAHTFAVEDGLELVLSCASATHMPFPTAAFDALYDHALLHHLNESARQLAIAEYRRVLRPHGLLVVSVLSEHDPENGVGPELEPGTFLGADGRLEHFFGMQELASALDGFAVESVVGLREPGEAPEADPRFYLRAVARRWGERELAARGRRKWGNQRPRFRRPGSGTPRHERTLS
jgi:SAM-dependent methyltransferase